jgi:hypothetical protein
MAMNRPFVVKKSTLEKSAPSRHDVYWDIDGTLIKKVHTDLSKKCPRSDIPIDNVFFPSVDGAKRVVRLEYKGRDKICSVFDDAGVLQGNYMVVIAQNALEELRRVLLIN